MWRPVLGLAVALAACRFDGSGVPFDAAGTPPADAPLGPDAPVDAAVDAGFDAPPDARVCPDSYVAIEGLSSYYRLGTSRVGWLAAERDCEDDAPSAAHLAVLDDEEELALVDPIVTERTWVGVSDRAAEGAYLRVIGGVAPFQPWRTSTGEPNDGVIVSEDCVELDGLEYNDEGCGDERMFLCECDGLPAVPAAYTPG